MQHKMENSSFIYFWIIFRIPICTFLAGPSIWRVYVRRGGSSCRSPAKACNTCKHILRKELESFEQDRWRTRWSSWDGGIIGRRLRGSKMRLPGRRPMAWWSGGIWRLRVEMRLCEMWEVSGQKWKVSCLRVRNKAGILPMFDENVNAVEIPPISNHQCWMSRSQIPLINSLKSWNMNGSLAEIMDHHERMAQVKLV